jgi:membrane-associated protein
MFQTLIDWVLHLDVHLAAFASSHAVLVYVVLFLVIFVETGVVVLPFLPGDSLLFVAGAMAAQGTFHLPVLMALLVLAAIASDSLNFAIGSQARRSVLETGRIRFVKPEHLARTHAFFDRHGPKTIVLARFVPIVRTLAPFVAALGDMTYSTFVSYNIVGALVWVCALLGAGVAFGNLPWVGDHLTVVILGIVVLSLVPGLVGWLVERGRARAAADGAARR